MARNRDPFGSTLHALHEWLTEGRILPGQPIIIVDEARHLRVSTTPVREALALLNGEGLLDRASYGGYSAARLDAADVRDLYQLHSLYISAVLPVVGRAPVKTHLLENVEQMFRGWIVVSGNRALEAAYGRLANRLARLRRIEGDIFQDLQTETRTLLAAWEATDIDLGPKVVAYHNRRIEAAGLLAAVAGGICSEPNR